MRRTAAVLGLCLVAGIAAGIASPGSGAVGPGWGVALARGALGFAGSTRVPAATPDVPRMPAAERVTVFKGLPVRSEMFRCEGAVLPVLAQLPPARAGALLAGRGGTLTVVRLGVRN